MEIENEFQVAAPVDRVWDYLLDIERVVPCMPGASLTETVDDRNWKGNIAVKVGPVSLNFAGRVEMTERDENAHRAVLKASGMEQRGKGAASATVTSTLDSVAGGTKVHVLQNLQISGQAAQLSRGMMQDVSTKLTKQFADCLQKNMGAKEADATDQVAATEPPVEKMMGGDASAQHAAAPAGIPQSSGRSKPIPGLRLGLGALWSAALRFFKRVFGKK